MSGEADPADEGHIECLAIASRKGVGLLVPEEVRFGRERGCFLDGHTDNKRRALEHQIANGDDDKASGG